MCMLCVIVLLVIGIFEGECWFVLHKRRAELSDTAFEIVITCSMSCLLPLPCGPLTVRSQMLDLRLSCLRLS